MFCYAGVLSPNILTVRSVQMARVAPVYVASSRCFFRLVVGTAVYYSIIRIYYSFFLCFTVDWHLDCFPWCPGAQICQLYMLQISFPTPGVTGKFGLGMWNEAGQRLMEFCQKNALVIVNPNTQLYLIKDVHFIVNCNTEKLDNIQIPISRRLFKYIMMLL